MVSSDRNFLNSSSLKVELTEAKVVQFTFDTGSFRSISQEEMDKEVAGLYLARSEGKVIQYICDTEKWHDAPSNAQLAYGYRVKPVTLHQSVQEFLDYKQEHSEYIDGFHQGAKFGVEWQKEQDNEK